MTPRASVGGGRRLAISWGDHLGSLAQPGVHLPRALPEGGQRRIQKDLSRFRGQAQRAPPVIADLPASPRQREQDPPFYLWVWVWHFRQYRLRALQRFFRLQGVAPRGSAIEVGFAQPQQPRATLGERCVRTSAEVLERGGVLVAQPPDLAMRIQRNGAPAARLRVIEAYRPVGVRERLVQPALPSQDARCAIEPEHQLGAVVRIDTFTHSQRLLHI